MSITQTCYLECAEIAPLRKAGIDFPTACGLIHAIGLSQHMPGDCTTDGPQPSPKDPEQLNCELYRYPEVVAGVVAVGAALQTDVVRPNGSFQLEG